MKKHNNVRAAVCAAAVVLCCSLSGCSLSFCGIKIGGKPELVFSCNEELPTENAGETKRILPADAAEEAKADPPAESEAKEAEADGTLKAVSGITDTGKVDLNSAGLEELMTLNGIGESRANAIIEYRTQNGPFSRIEDIMQVSGIKEGVFSKIQAQIVVR